MGGLFSTSVFLTIINIAIPSEKTAYMMVAAWQPAEELASLEHLRKIGVKI
jgi:hypothetical protein